VSRFTYHVFICENQRGPDDPRGCCKARGSEKVRELFKTELKRLGLKGKVRANKAGCLDACQYGPSVVIYPEGTWYSVPTQEDVLEIVQTHLVKGEIVERLLMPPSFTREKKEP